MTPKKEKKYSALGCLPQAAFGNFLIGAFFLCLGIFFGGPKIYLELNKAILIFGALTLVYVFLTWWSIRALDAPNTTTNLTTTGPYHFVRHPMYAAVIFILNPALGILLRSWPLFLSGFISYFIWKKCADREENRLIEKFGHAYLDYQARVGRFFPNLRRINKPVFYCLTGIVFFAIIFVALNWKSFYQRWTRWDEKSKIVYDRPENLKYNFNSDGGLPPAAGYNAAPNSIYIPKINARAPIVSVADATPKNIETALNAGVVLYPDSARPGQIGEAAITGHSSVFPWNKTSYGQIFALLDKLENNDTIHIIYGNRQYDYRVTDKKILPPNQVKTSPTTEKKLLISTCWPIGASFKRLVIYAVLDK